MSRLHYILDHARQLTRFAAVGFTCFIVSIGVLTGLHELAGVYYLVAYGAAFVVSSTLGYLLNGRFTFGTQGAVEFVSRQTLLEDLISRLSTTKAGGLEPFEALLRVKIARGVPVGTELVAVRERTP